MSAPDGILEQVLSLPEAERARLAEALIRSLDPPGEDVSEEECRAAWAAEILARSDAVHNGTAKLVDWRESLDTSRTSLRERRKP
jgi:putative addiction module component (TIGR02574 family)